MSTRPRPASAPTRRQVLSALLLAPAALAGVGACALPTGPGTAAGPDPLIALADQARADVALAIAAVAADPALAERIEPLRAARAAHGTALDVEVARLDPTATATAGRPAAGAAATPVTLARVREAVLTSGRNAADVALGLPADRVGLVASVAACCATYGAVLA